MDYGAGPAKDLGPRPHLAWLPLDQLYIDPNYQRQVSKEGRRNIGLIVERFSWSKFGTLTVAPGTEGRHAVIDGQHRYLAAEAHPGITEVPYCIVQAPEVKHQAKSFLAINQDRTAMNPFAMHHAGVAAGDPDALHLQKVVDAAGLRIPRSNLSAQSWQPDMVRFPRVILDQLAQWGDKPVVAALKVVADAAGREAKPASAGLFRALVQVYLVSPEANGERLAEVLAKKPMDELHKAAKAYQSMFGGTQREAMRVAIVRLYNKGLRNLPALPESLKAEGVGHG